MTERGLNLFDDFAVECVGRRVYLFFLGDSKMFTPGTIANSQTQRLLTKINKNDAVTISMEPEIL